MPNWCIESDKPRSVKIGKRISASIITNAGTPQGCVLSPILLCQDSPIVFLDGQFAGCFICLSAASYLIRILQQGEVENRQDSGPRGTGLKSPALYLVHARLCYLAKTSEV